MQAMKNALEGLARRSETRRKEKKKKPQLVKLRSHFSQTPYFLP
jgi:hypothetical protein